MLGDSKSTRSRYNCDCGADIERSAATATGSTGIQQYSVMVWYPGHVLSHGSGSTNQFADSLTLLLQCHEQICNLLFVRSPLQHGINQITGLIFAQIMPLCGMRDGLLKR